MPMMAKFERSANRLPVWRLRPVPAI